MVGLSCFDMMYLFSSLFLFSAPHFWPAITETFIFTHAITLLLPLAHIGLTGMIIGTYIRSLTSLYPGSIILTMCLALERFITVCHPFYKLNHGYDHYKQNVCEQKYLQFLKKPNNPSNLKPS